MSVCSDNMKLVLYSNINIMATHPTRTHTHHSTRRDFVHLDTLPKQRNLQGSHPSTDFPVRVDMDVDRKHSVIESSMYAAVLSALTVRLESTSGQAY